MSVTCPLLLIAAAWVGSAPYPLATGSPCTAARTLPGSYLFVPPAGADDSEQLEATPYVPQAGDLILFRTGSFFYRAAFRLTVTGPPTHVGIVVELPVKPGLLRRGHHAKPEVRFAVLECVDHRSGVQLMALPGRLQTYEGKVWVRRLKTPLSAEQSAELTHFAIEQQGKSYARHRLILPVLVPFLRCRLFARLCPDKDFRSRQAWFCSELVAAACVRSDLLAADRARPWCTFPLDFFDDDLLDLRDHWDPVRPWGERAEAPPGD